GPAGRQALGGERAEQRPRVGRAEDELPAVAPAQPLQERWGRTDQVGLWQRLFANQRLQPVRQHRRLDLRGVAVGMLVGILHEAAEGRIAVALAGRDLGSEECGVVVAGSGLDAEVLGTESLYQDTARRGAPSGASSHLGQQLEGALAGAEVWQE